MANASEHKAVHGNLRGGAKGKQVQPPKYDYHYVRYTPSKEDKQRLKGSNISFLSAFDHLTARLDGTHKFSLSYDGANGTFVASLTCNREGDPNFKHILTGRGSEAETAIIWLAYLDNVVFEGIWVTDAMSDWSLD